MNIRKKGFPEVLRHCFS